MIIFCVFAVSSLYFIVDVVVVAVSAVVVQLYSEQQGDDYSKNRGVLMSCAQYVCAREGDSKQQRSQRSTNFVESYVRAPYSKPALLRVPNSTIE